MVGCFKGYPCIRQQSLRKRTEATGQESRYRHLQSDRGPHQYHYINVHCKEKLNGRYLTMLTIKLN
jgi:hypothetical protein